MKPQLIITPGAEADIKNIGEWYGNIQLNLEENFRRYFDEALEHISHHPQSSPMIVRHIRRKRVPRFPYVIYYDWRDNLIRILAVMHTSRHPHSWQARKH